LEGLGDFEIENCRCYLYFFEVPSEVSMGKEQYGDGVGHLHPNICVAVLGAIVDEKHDDWNQRDEDSENIGSNQLRSPAPEKPSTLIVKKKKKQYQRNDKRRDKRRDRFDRNNMFANKSSGQTKLKRGLESKERIIFLFHFQNSSVHLCCSQFFSALNSGRVKL
jgi:hypothetical protein